MWWTVESKSRYHQHGKPTVGVVGCYGRLVRQRTQIADCCRCGAECPASEAEEERNTLVPKAQFLDPAGVSSARYRTWVSASALVGSQQSAPM